MILTSAVWPHRARAGRAEQRCVGGSIRPSLHQVLMTLRDQGGWGAERYNSLDGGFRGRAKVPGSPLRYRRSVRVTIVGMGRPYRLLRPKPTAAEQRKRTVALMVLAVLAGGYAVYLFLKPPPPPDWPQTRAAVIQHAGKTGRNLVRWTDKTGTVRTARVGKCAPLQDGSSSGSPTTPTAAPLTSRPSRCAGRSDSWRPPSSPSSPPAPRRGCCGGKVRHRR